MRAFLFVFYIYVNNFVMIVPLIFLAGITILCYMLAINRLFKKPLLKNNTRVNKNFGLNLLNGLFVLQNKNFTLAFFKNFYLNVISKEFNFKIKINTNKTFIRYYISNSYLRLYYQDLTITFYKNKFIFKSTANTKVQFIIEKPNCQFFLNTKNSTFTIKNDTTLNFFAVKFDKFEVQDLNKYLILQTNLNGIGEICLNQNFNILNKDELKNFKSENFGFYDVEKWEFMPYFKDSASNKLQEKFQINLLDKYNKTIFLPNFNYKESFLEDFSFEIENYLFLSLDKLGFSKLVHLKQSKNKLIVQDVLVNFEYVFNLKNIFNARLLSLWGENYLLIQTTKNFVEFKIFDKYLDSKILSKSLIYPDLKIIRNNNLSLSFIFENINRLILHGFNIDVFKIINSLNLKYLPEYMQFKICNCLLSYINTFNKQYKITQLKLKSFLLKNLVYSIKNLNSSSFCFLKKILPYITEQKISNNILDLILECKSKFKNANYEFFLSEILGIRLEGTKLFITPSKANEIKTKIWIKGKVISISITKNWQVLKVDGLTLSGIDYFDLKNFGSILDLEFI